MASQVSGPLGQKYGNDPVTFAVNMCKDFHASFVKLSQRMADRTGVKTWVTNQKDPRTGKRYSARMVAHNGDSSQTVALITALWAVKAPGDFRDEAGRLAFNLPTGAHSLDGVPNATYGLSWPVPWGGGKGEDPITAGVVLTAGVAIFTAIAPFIIPRLIALVGAIASGAPVDQIIDAAVTGKAPESPDAGGAAPPPDEGLIFGVPEEYVLVGAAGVLAFVVLRG